MKRFLSQIQDLGYSPIVLIAVNLIPLGGVIFFEWNSFLLISIYWAECLVVGLVALFKAFVATFYIKKWSHLADIFNFTIGFSFFIVLYGAFVTDLFGGEIVNNSTDMVTLLKAIFDQPLIWWAFIGYLGSHWFYFFYHFLWKKEYARKGVREILLNAMWGLGVLTLVFMGGSGMILNLSGSTFALSLLIVAKIILHLWVHGKEHYLTENT